LHDEIGQSLTALKITLETMRKHCAEPAQRDPLLQAIDITNMLVSDVREIARRLRPPQLDDLGLLAALRSHVDGLRQASGLKITLSTDCLHQRLPADLELACFRIVQEAINNVIRHAAATKVRVTVECKLRELLLARIQKVSATVSWFFDSTSYLR
jgi:two-component system sensor histidine kinase UhpB